MFPFWDLAIEPVLTAAGATRVVEIGALRGDTTVRLLRLLGPDAELHVIDPDPGFDPSEHERRFGGRYAFHRDLSLRVLPDLPVMDAALIDGDHNWYTVHEELRLLATAARREGRPLPVLILHDVGWPYGRRDQYHDPANIPADQRQPCARRGIRPGVSGLVDVDGMNAATFNAEQEGGPRNGVMTALEDFMAEHDRPLSCVVLPAYFGLAIVAEETRLHEQPALAGQFERLASGAGQEAGAELAEQLRLAGLMDQHVLFFGAQRRLEGAARRYLDLLKGALLDEHHLEQELRIHQLARCLETGADPYGESVRDPTRRLLGPTAELRALRRQGRLGPDDERMSFALTTMGRTRLDHIQACLDAVRTDSVPGDLVDCGVGRGGAAVFLRGYLEGHEWAGPDVVVVDRFRAAPDGRSTTDPPGPGSRLPGGGMGFPDLLADVISVRDAFDRFGLLDTRVRFVQGELAATLPSAPLDRISLLRVGETAGAEATTVLDELYDRVSPGGFVLVDQYTDPAVAAAVDAFRARRGIDDPLERVDWASVAWRRTGSPDPSGSADRRSLPGDTGRPVPLLAPAGADVCDLTVVVVFHDMRREAVRTLHSLSPAYQQGLDDIDYEVVVVENGSSDDQRLGDELVRSYGPRFRYIDMGPDAPASPAAALNRGLAEGRGDALALMIDGAHVLTPGVLRAGLDGLRTYAPAVVATQQWFVGPGEQSEAIAEGYDPAVEDELFDRIGWPVDGYRLFDIGHAIGDRDWFDGMWESNCLFAPRSLLEQVGGFDERFVAPGGGYVNLELFERLTESPGVRLVTVLGEASFHQVHGGTTTNRPDPDARRRAMAAHADEFERLRGRRFWGHNKQMHYVGTMRAEAARTRARRRVLPNLFDAGPTKGIPDAPLPIPRDLRAAFVEAYWENLGWRRTNWLGHRVPVPPADLVAYQELISRVRPDVIIETGTGRGGRALFLASICELVGHGRVVSVDHDVWADRPTHDRLTYVAGAAHERATFEQVSELVGGDGALLILGSRAPAGKTFAEFKLFEPLVPVGSYVVIADTVLNGHPVWPDFGAGPREALKGVVDTRPDFTVDRSMDRYTPSFGPGGFLRRIG